jgi:hypothetical protein
LLLSFRAKTRRPRRCASEATPDAIAKLFHADPAKAFVMTCIGQLVADGYAEWAMLDNGDIQLSFGTGETFLLGERGIIPLA